MKETGNLLDSMLTRRSVRSYRSDPVPQEVLDSLVRAGFSAPSAMAQRACHFIAMTGDKLAKLVAECPNTPKGAPAAIVVCVDEDLLKVPRFGDVDAAAATENIVLAAHVSGLASVWSAPRPEDYNHYRRVLGLPARIRPFSIVPVGYSDERPAQTDRYDPSRAHVNGW
jgi:nitroreductase